MMNSLSPEQREQLGQLMAQALADADLALVDAAFLEGRDTVRGVHLTARRAAEAALEAGGIGRLVLTHIPPWTSREDVISEAKAEFDGPVHAVVCNELLDVTRR